MQAGLLEIVYLKIQLRIEKGKLISYIHLLLVCRLNNCFYSIAKIPKENYHLSQNFKLITKCEL